MKIFISFIIFSISISMFSQAPVIEGNQFACINTESIATVTNDITYDSYQWYSKFTFEEDTAYLPIEGATSSTFTYNFMMNENTIKIVTTLNGISYESNAITIEVTYDNGVSIFEEIEGEGFYNGEFFEMCEDNGVLILNVPEIYAQNVQWYKDDILIENEISQSLTISESGNYYAKSSREHCPLDFRNSNNIIVVFENCETADTDNNNFENSIQLYPNPTKDKIFITNLNNLLIKKYEIYSIDGKKLSSKEVSDELKFISLENLAVGTYIIKLYKENNTIMKKIIKE